MASSENKSSMVEVAQHLTAAVLVRCRSAIQESDLESIAEHQTGLTEAVVHELQTILAECSLGSISGPLRDAASNVLRASESTPAPLQKALCGVLLLHDAAQNPRRASLNLGGAMGSLLGATEGLPDDLVELLCAWIPATTRRLGQDVPSFNGRRSLSLLLGIGVLAEAAANSAMTLAASYRDDRSATAAWEQTHDVEPNDYVHDIFGLDPLMSEDDRLVWLDFLGRSKAKLGTTAELIARLLIEADHSDRGL